MNIKKIKPLWNQVITTMNRYEVTEDAELVTSKENKGDIKEYQTVVAVGPLVRDIKVGDVVMLDFKNYEVRKYKENSIKDELVTTDTVIGHKFNAVILDNVQYLMLNDRDVMFIIEEFE